MIETAASPSTPSRTPATAGRTGAECTHAGPADVGSAGEAAAAGLEGEVLPPGSPHGAYARGILLYCAGRDRQAAAALEEAAARRPRGKTCHVLGLCRADLGEWEAALAAFSRALELEPDLLQAHYQAAAARRRLGRFKEAVRGLEAALERFASTTYAGYLHNELGLTHEQGGDLDRAVEHFRAAAAAPGVDTVPARVNLALLLYKRGQTSEAREILEPLVQRLSYREILHPQPHTCFLAYYLLGNLALDDQDPMRAVELYRLSLCFRPHAAAVWNRLAVAWEEAGHRVEARRALEQALAVDPSYETARFNLARFGAGGREGGAG